MIALVIFGIIGLVGLGMAKLDDMTKSDNQNPHDPVK